MTKVRVVMPDRLAIGIVLIAAGALLLLDQAGMLEVGHPVRLWPLAPLAIGLGILFKPAGQREGAGWLLLVGVMFLLHNFEVLHIRDSWPLFLVAGGLGVVWSALRGPVAARKEKEN
jgi:hypothetical protein